MKIQYSLLPMTAAALAGCTGTPEQSAAFKEDGQSKDLGRPNIVVIITDQQRADLTAREGFPCDLTPFADRMAAQGACFNRAYTPCPASGPARVAALTGRFQSVTHADSNHNLLDAVYGKDLFDVARESGYNSILVGKNHSHMTKEHADYWLPYDHLGQPVPDEEKTPENAEFDRYLKTLSFFTDLEPSRFKLENQLPYRMVTDALDWTAEHGKDKPFVMWFAVNEPHNPYQVCEPYYSMFDGQIPDASTDASALKYKGEKYILMQKQMNECHIGTTEHMARIRANYMGMIRLVDDQIERLVEGFKEQGLYDNTIFVITSDHGDYCGEYGLMKKGAGLDDATTRIPMVWFGKGIEASGLRDDCVSLVDIMPTACEIMGHKIPMGAQGRSILNMLEGQSYPKEEFRSILSEHGFGGQFITEDDDPKYFYDRGALNPKPFYDELNTWSQSGRTCMVRKGDWKIIVDMLGNVRLYNLAKDPVELKNLAGKCSTRRKENEMMQELLKWQIGINDPIPVPRRRYTQKRLKHNYMFFGEPETK